ncbi:unnamed protein product [Brachionus calyciflorus]|uniref:Uncharacterized protein n=1 Tax=Brachionus calyciflorus TaxID=104777 RepID=A0A813UXJ5_9BILA|nr:unnamed protein product [Brachionus calyciflorus]
MAFGIFMVRSVLKVSQEELKKRESMSSNTKKQKRAKANFILSILEKEMLHELEDLLSSFEFVTNELQSNKVSISRVYPGVHFLQKKLSDESILCVHTENLRRNLLKSLTKRFGSLIKNDVFILLFKTIIQLSLPII